MSKIRSKETKIEVALRRELWRAGYRYRKNASGYFGKPDVLLKRYKTVIFIDSCFWHGCKKHFRLPSSKIKYWKQKIKKNIKRDTAVNKHYKKLGWRVIRIWEHQIKKDLAKTAERVIEKL